MTFYYIYKNNSFFNFNDSNTSENINEEEQEKKEGMFYDDNDTNIINIIDEELMNKLSDDYFDDELSYTDFLDYNDDDM